MSPGPGGARGKPPKSAPKLRYRVVYDGLRGRILSGRWAAGVRLPTELELCREYGVSLITVRQAEDLLVAEGLIEKRQGSGTYVSGAVAGRLKLLWVSGVSPDGADTSAYYRDCLRLCREEARAAGLGMDHAWLSNWDPAAAVPWCAEETLGLYAGLVLVGCSGVHQLLRRAVELDKPHVHIGGMAGATGRGVSRDLAQALRLCLERLGDPAQGPVLVLRMEGPASDVMPAGADAGWDLRPLVVPQHDRESVVESLGYLRMREQLDKADAPRRVIFLDDILARGASRAILEQGAGRSLQVCVVCGLEEVVPLGLPVTYVVHDLAAQVRDAVAQLREQVSGAPARATLHPYRVLAETPEELARRALDRGPAAPARRKART